MEQQFQVNDNEKKLLTAIGRYPDLSHRALLDCTTYKQVKTIPRKMAQFKEQDILWGPVYLVDYGKLCKNPLHRLFCVVEVNRNYKTVISYLQLIEPLIWVYPVLSSHKELLCAGVLSSDDAKVEALLRILKDHDIIAGYRIRARQHQLVIENPDFSGDPLPLLDNVLAPCDIPDISFQPHDTDWSECDIRTLSYLQGGYTSKKIIDIMRKERTLHNRVWTYEQIRYSFKKMVTHSLVKKSYLVFPYPLDQCADFYLFLKTGDIYVTQQMLCNFAKGERIHREYTLYGDWGLIGCICHPQFVVGLMHELDRLEEIEKKELYHLRSFPPGTQYVGEHAEFDYFDVDTQIMEYPYQVFRENIKGKLENEQ
jgi:hypothetical protein